MSNIAPEHGPTPIGEFGDNRHLGGYGGSRPAKPGDGIGTVSPAGPESASPFADPRDPDRDMDAEGPGDLY